MAETPISADSATEAWLREAFARVLLELMLFSRTFAAFVLHPGRSAREWHDGERAFMNPLGFAATAAGVYWASIGTLAALVLTASARWFAHARGTNALELRSGDPVLFVLFIAAVTSYALICLAMARALMALHRTAGWKVVIAGAFAIVVTAVLFGSVLPDGNYGWHPYISVDVDGGFALAFGFRG